MLASSYPISLHDVLCAERRPLRELFWMVLQAPMPLFYVAQYERMLMTINLQSTRFQLLQNLHFRSHFRCFNGSATTKGCFVVDEGNLIQHTKKPLFVISLHARQSSISFRWQKFTYLLLILT